MIYIDDGLGCADTYEEAKDASRTTQEILQKSGFCTNDKSIWEPTQRLTWLGIEVDLKAFRFFIPTERKQKTLKRIQSVLANKTCSARELAKVVGSIISLKLPVGNIVCLFTRLCYRAINESPTWDHKLVLDEGSKHELKFWEQRLPVVETERISQSTLVCKRAIFVDASGFGVGAWTQGLTKWDVQDACSRQLTAEEIGTSSTFRELKAIEFGISRFGEKMKNSNVKVFCDNQSAVGIAEKGSSKAELHQIVLSIHSLCFRWGIKMETQWVPRDRNQLANLLSRLKDPDDWQVHPAVFGLICARWGRPNFDRFAFGWNAKCSLFNSRWMELGCAGVDAFAQNWAGFFNWLTPPPRLIFDTIRHLENCKATGVLIAPEWKSADFWPLLSRVLKSQVCKDTLRFPAGNAVFAFGSSPTSIFRPLFPSPVLAILLDFA